MICRPPHPSLPPLQQWQPANQPTNERNTRYVLAVGDDDAFRFAGRATRVHDDRARIGFGWGRWIRMNITTRHKVIETHNFEFGGKCDFGKIRMRFGRCNQITRVHNVCQSGHFRMLINQSLHIFLIAHNEGNVIVDNRFNDSIHPECRIYSRHCDTLRKGTHRGDHPFGTSVFKNCHPTGDGHTIECRRIRCRLQSCRSQGSTELMCFDIDVGKGPPRNRFRIPFDFARHIPSLKDPRSHATNGSVPCKRIFGQIIQCFDALTRCGSQFMFVAWIDTMRRISIDRDRSHRSWSQIMTENPNPSKSDDGELESG